ncbi:LysR family transcriptional regulator [Xanthomonas sp. WHRI 1810A]|uniref:LysR family transcriptional regulator n=1 Tax=Xanthomonas sp. WHRI 1810A TaxID=3161565 RepID=UPI0032E8D91E
MANMNVEMGDLRALVAVAELGSFSAAARELHLSQPALSRRISKLEANLGVRLVERTTRRVELTATGRDFARKARQVVNTFEESLLGIGEGTGRIRGEVTVACVPTAVKQCLLDVVKAYRQRYPQILVRVLDDGASDVLSTVVRNEADFGINYIGVQEANLEFIPIFKEQFVMVCRHDHALASRAHVTWAELKKHDYIAVTKASGNRLLLDLALADIPDLPEPICEARHVRTVVDMVVAGLGVAAVPALAVLPHFAEPALRAIPLTRPTVHRTIGLIKRRGRVLSPAAERLYQMITEATGETAR